MEAYKSVFTGNIIFLFVLLTGGISIAVTMPCLDGDFNEDCVIDIDDLSVFAGQWMDDGDCLTDDCANLDNYDNINLADFSILAANWQDSSNILLINEFMAINGGNLLDGDGNESDWIELYNACPQTLNLSGWYLTDDPDELAKWPLPDIDLAGYEYLVIFASGQDVDDYQDPANYYHTNFKLSGDGEYLALVNPEGGIAHEYDLRGDNTGYPEQEENISYGLPEGISTTEVIVNENADKKVLIPISSIGYTWIGDNEPYDDSDWEDYTEIGGMSGGVGYDTDAGRDYPYAQYITYDVETQMLDHNSNSCYIRIPFTIDFNPSNCTDLTLKIRYDDGFACFINGTEMARANVSTLEWNSSAAAGHADEEAVVFQSYDISEYVHILGEGTNILAIHGLNRPQPNGRSSDFLISVELEAAYTVSADTDLPDVAYFDNPTPGAMNNGAVMDFVADTNFNIDRGFYENPFDVIISCDTEDAEIRYTLDGSTPSMSDGITYNGPINVAETTCIRAAAFKSGWLSSNVDTQTYIFIDDVIAQGTTPPQGWPTSEVNGQVFDYGMDSKVLTDSRYSDLIDDALMDIPSLSIVTDLEHLFDPTTGIYVNAMQDGYLWERPVSMELLNPDGSEGFQVNAGFRIRGGMSRNARNPKHSFRFFFRSEYGASKLNYPLFGDEGVDQFDKIDLRTGQNFSWHLSNSSSVGKSTWLYDIFSRDAGREMDQPYTRSRYYHLYINGQYWGLFQSEERPESRYAASYYGGDNEDYDAIKSGDDNGVIEAVDGYLDSYYQLWTEVNNGLSNNEDYFRIQGLDSDGSVNPELLDDESYTRLLDVDNLIDFMILVFYCGNRDAPLGPPNSSSQPRNLMGFYNRVEPDGFQFVAHDGEHNLGVHLTEGVNYDHIDFVTPLDTNLELQENCNPWWLHISLMDDNQEYRMRFADRVYEHFFNDGILTPAGATALLEAREEEMSMAVIAESARWGDYVTKSYAMVRADWENIVGQIKNDYINASPNTRTDVVISQIVNAGWYPSVEAPSFIHGGAVEKNYSLMMTAATGTIYYTLDGSDPRQVGGVVNPDANVYTSGITLTESCVVKARAIYNSQWSPLHEADFAVDDIVESLRITEIMYNPVDPNNEYIELKNIGVETINLAMVRFTDGINFTFPSMDIVPGEFIVIVGNQSETDISPSIIAGEYTGSLSNGGEQLVLEDAIGRTIHQFEYNDWYDITDGEGFSLEIIEPTDEELSNWSIKESWRPSTYNGGSPGENIAGYAPGDIVINELLAHSDQAPNDWVELHNTTDQLIDIGGWFLSDDGDDDPNLMKYEIPAGTEIPAGGYIVLNQDEHFGGAFAFSENGDEVYLTSAVDGQGQLTGYRQEEDFGASEVHVSFGRYEKSTGEISFVAMDSRTPGTANSFPKVGPIVISEIMYHHDTDANVEYVELYNDSSSEVDLFDSESNSWSFTEGIECLLPTPTSIPAHSYLVLAKDIAAFELAYPGVLALQWDSGRLDNDGEKVEISLPGDLVEGVRQYIRVDRVGYDDISPWPIEADGGGQSLHRKVFNEYGNDVINWQAASPTPGQ